MTGEARTQSKPWWRQMPLSAWILLFGLWVLLSGHYDAFHLGTGLLVVAWVAWRHSRLPATPEHRPVGLRSLRVVFYVFWLFGQIMLSAIYVARVIIRPDKHLNPRLIAFRSRQPSMVSHVILANSITLTPGTVSIDLDDDRYLVHALTPVTAEGTLDGTMAARVARLSSDEAINLPEALNPEEMAPA